MADSDQRVEIGHYFQILATTHNPPLRHMTLETNGTGKREIRISYIGSMPAWKSNYRVLLTGGATTATLQGWAVVDNPSEQNWTDVLLTLVSGAPSSFIQQTHGRTTFRGRRSGCPGRVDRRTRCLPGLRRTRSTWAGVQHPSPSRVECSFRQSFQLLRVLAMPPRH